MKKRFAFTQSHVGRYVLAKRHPGSYPVRARVVKVTLALPHPTGIACIARINADGSLRKERIWTGQWYDVWPE